MQVFDTPWCEPEAMARAVYEGSGDMVFLHSTMDVSFSGHYSILAYAPLETVKGRYFDDIASKITTHGKKYQNAWFGYLGYELLHTLEAIPETVSATIAMPPLWMVRFGVIIVWDHKNHCCKVWCDQADAYDQLPQPIPSTKCAPKVASLSSNMTKEIYCTHVERVIDAIARGDLYQANVTRKFYGEFEATLSGIELFLDLCRASPAPYSAYMRFDDYEILSSSPEQFLTMDEYGNVASRPIKGSAPRFDDVEKDKASRIALQHSAKDQSENLMIVDLMRNDFSRGCEAGSVKVDKLFDVTSYQTVHHMASKVEGKKRSHVSPVAFVSGCFPPGSMTGAPKIKAMEYCADIEKIDRGVYSGAIGWFGGDGACDLSVVIRTLIVEKKKFEFQVGGGIVADSTALSEWEETLIKAKGIASVLGLDPHNDLVF